MNYIYVGEYRRAAGIWINDLRKSGHNVDTVAWNFSVREPFLHYKAEEGDITAVLDNVLMNHGRADALLTINYYPEISNYAMSRGIRYISWVWDFPQRTIYSATIVNNCNEIFIPDKALAEMFSESGIKTIKYAPYAIDPDEYESSVTDTYTADVTYLGNYNTQFTIPSQAAIDKCLDSTKGYIDGLVSTQSGIYNIYVIENSLPGYVMEDLKRSCPVEIAESSVETEEWLYSQYLLLPRLTYADRLNVLYKAAGTARLTVYSKDPVQLNMNEIIKPEPKVCERKKLFAESKINIDIPDRARHGALSPKCLEIMASGGFLLTAYQTGLADHFNQGEDLVMYEDLDSLCDLIKYYLADEHEQEREQIAASGRNKALGEKPPLEEQFWA